MAVQAQIKYVQGALTLDGVAGDVAHNAAGTLSNSDGSGTTWKWKVRDLSGAGASSADEKSVAYIKGQVLGTTATVSFTPDMYGSFLIELIVNEGLSDEAIDIIELSVPYPSHPAVRIVNIPPGTTSDMANYVGNPDGNAYACDGWLSALRLASQGHFRKNAIGAAATEGAFVENTTAAAAGAQQWSPVFAFAGKGWDTGASASRDVRFGVQTRPVQGSPVTGEFHFLANINGAGYSSVGQVSSAGLWTLPSLTVSGTTTISGYVPTTRRIIAGSGIVVSGGGGGSNDQLTADITIAAAGGGSGVTWVNNATEINRGKFHVDGTLLVITDDGAGPNQVTLTAPGYALAATTMTAGAGLTGGGDLSANRTFDVVAHADGSIIVNANDIQVGVLASDAQHGNRGGGGIHALVVAGGNAGFMSGSDKTKLDGLPSSAVPTSRTLSMSNSDLTIDGGSSADFSANRTIALSSTLAAKTLKGLTVAPDAATGTIGAATTYTVPNHTAITATQETFILSTNAPSWEWSSGTTASQRFYNYQGPTVTGTGGTATFTNIYTAFFTPPVASTNATFTSAAAIGIEAAATATWGITINKTGSAAANNRGIDFRRAGTSRGQLVLDSNDSLVLQTPSGLSQIYANDSLGSRVVFSGQTFAVGGNFLFLTSLVTTKIGYFVTTPTAQHDFGTFAQTSGVAPSFLFTESAHTGQTQATESRRVRWNMGVAVTWANTSANHVALQRCFHIEAPTLNFANATGTPEFTKSATVAISGPPVMGANAVAGAGGRWTLFLESGGMLVEQLGAAWGDGLKLHTTDTPANTQGFSSPRVCLRGSGKAASTLYPQEWQLYMKSDQRALNDAGTLYGSFVIENSIAAETMFELKSGGTTGKTFAFCGVTPVARPTYTESNVTPTRTFDADTVTLPVLADVVGTLIADKRAQGQIL